MWVQEGRGRKVDVELNEKKKEEEEGQLQLECCGIEFRGLLRAPSMEGHIFDTF